MTASSASVSLKRSSEFDLPVPKKTTSQSLGLGLIPFFNCAIGLDKEGKVEEMTEARIQIIQSIWCDTYHLKVSDILKDKSLDKARRLAIILKLAGHIFSWEEKLPIHPYQEASYYGFSELITIPFLLGYLEDPSIEVSFLGQGERRWISNFFKACFLGDSLSSGDYISLSEQMVSETQKAFLFSSGNKTHQTFIVIWGKYLIMVNRGAGSSNSPGIKVYNLTDRSILTPEVLNFMVNIRGHSTDNWPSFDWVEKTLKLKSVFIIKMSAQKVGNCTWASVKGVLRVALAIKSITVQGLYASFYTTYSPYKILICNMKNHFTKDLLSKVASSQSEREKAVFQTCLSKIPQKYHK